MSKKNKNSDAYLRLPPKRQRFVDEYVIDSNGTQAAIRAGYSMRTATSQADRLLTFADVKAAIDAKLAAIAENNEVKADNVIKEICKIGFCNVKDVASWKGNTLTLKDSDEIPDEVMAAISEISIVDGDIKLKFHSKTKALEMLGRYLALFTDKHQVAGEGLGIILNMAGEAAKKERSDK